jgi:hypothetical protein
VLDATLTPCFANDDSSSCCLLFENTHRSPILASFFIDNEINSQVRMLCRDPAHAHKTHAIMMMTMMMAGLGGEEVLRCK